MKRLWSIALVVMLLLVILVLQATPASAAMQQSPSGTVSSLPLPLTVTAVLILTILVASLCLNYNEVSRFLLVLSTGQYRSQQRLNLKMLFTATALIVLTAMAAVAVLMVAAVGLSPGTALIVAVVFGVVTLITPVAHNILRHDYLYDANTGKHQIAAIAFSFFSAVNIITFGALTVLMKKLQLRYSLLRQVQMQVDTAIAREDSAKTENALSLHSAGPTANTSAAS